MSCEWQYTSTVPLQYATLPACIRHNSLLSRLPQMSLAEECAYHRRRPRNDQLTGGKVAETAGAGTTRDVTASIDIGSQTTGAQSVRLYHLHLMSTEELQNKQLDLPPQVWL